MAFKWMLTTAPALALLACGPGYDEPGALESELEEDMSEPGDAVDPSEIRTEQADNRAAGDRERDMPASGDAFTLETGWVRNAVGGRDMTAGYVTLGNSGPAARLVGAQSPEAERIELHTMAMDGDVMRMRQVEGFDIPAGATLTLRSGGDHLMIFGLSSEASADGELELVLTFEDGRTFETALPFADSAPGAAMSGTQDG